MILGESRGQSVVEITQRGMMSSLIPTTPREITLCFWGHRQHLGLSFSVTFLFNGFYPYISGRITYARAFQIGLL